MSRARPIRPALAKKIVQHERRIRRQELREDARGGAPVPVWAGASEIHSAPAFMKRDETDDYAFWLPLEQDSGSDLGTEGSWTLEEDGSASTDTNILLVPAHEGAYVCGFSTDFRIFSDDPAGEGVHPIRLLAGLAIYGKGGGSYFKETEFSQTLSFDMEVGENGGAYIARTYSVSVSGFAPSVTGGTNGDEVGFAGFIRMDDIGAIAAADMVIGTGWGYGRSKVWAARVGAP